MTITPLERECARVAVRARTIQIRDFRYAIDGSIVTLEGTALTPDGVDSVGKLFETTSAGEVRNGVVHVEQDPDRPGTLRAPDGYVAIVELGPNAARLAEATIWEVAEGDSLQSIAESVYGDPAQSTRIQIANQLQLGPDGHIRAGQKLKIPIG